MFDNRLASTVAIVAAIAVCAVLIMVLLLKWCRAE